MKSVDAAFSDGIVTVGALPNAPLAVTTLFEATVGPVADADADAEPDAEAELDGGFELEEDGEDEQPAMATEAIAGIARSAAARRIETSRVRQAVTMRGWP
ncbi:MAG TPA: hypothetical protein VNV62_20895 [Trebonia sp.]|nr:hypothetical protein [Trebonia sp.]